MNDIQTRPRLLRESLESALSMSPAVVVTGSRQTGKTVLVRELAPRDRRYETLDDLEVVAVAREDPADLVNRAPRITLDEVQRVPEILLAVKREVDVDRRAGRFLLTGSANLLLMRAVSESLAGRATYLELGPLTRAERDGRPIAGLWDDLLDAPDEAWVDLIAGSDRPPGDWRAEALLGGFPVPVWELERDADRAHWLAGFVRTFLERDLQDLSSIDNLVDYRRFMRAVALRTGTIVNQTELGRDIGISQPTVRRWLNLLETACQIKRLPGYAVNRTKRLIKSPKIFWTDSALALHLAGLSAPTGAFLENLVLMDLLAWSGAKLSPPQILHWRTTDQKEVDFVIETRNAVVPIEVKATRKPKASDARHLKLFRAEYAELSRAALLLHGGDETFRIADGVVAAPWWKVI